MEPFLTVVTPDGNTWLLGLLSGGLLAFRHLLSAERERSDGRPRMATGARHGKPYSLGPAPRAGQNKPPVVELDGEAALRAVGEVAP